METIAAGDDVALEPMLLALVLKPNGGARSGDVLERNCFRFKQQLAPGREPRCDQILHDLLLPVDAHLAAVDELRHVHVNKPALEADVEDAIGHALPHQAVSHAELMHQVDRALLEHAGAHAPLHILAAARLEDDALDALTGQQQRKKKTGRSGPDDSNLCSHVFVCNLWPGWSASVIRDVSESRNSSGR